MFQAVFNDTEQQDSTAFVECACGEFGEGSVAKVSLGIWGPEFDNLKSTQKPAGACAQHWEKIDRWVPQIHCLAKMGNCTNFRLKERFCF